MKKILSFAVVLPVVIALTGCPAKEKTTLSDGDKKFTLASDREVSIPQGGVATLVVSAARTGFDQDVKLTIDKLPPGVQLTGEELVISKGTKEVKVTLKADPEAKLVKGHETTIQGKADKFEATHKLTVNVTEKKKPAGEAIGTELEKKQAEAKVWYETQKKEFDNQIANLQKRADVAAGDAKTNINKAIKDLREKKARLDETFDRTKVQTEAAWDEFYTGLKKAGKELSDATRKALDQYK